MKKLLLGSIALTLFSVSILLFQISCKKEATAAQEPAGAGGVNQLGLIVFKKNFMRLGGNAPKQSEFWIANIDGSNPRLLPLNVPGQSISDVKLSPNGKTIVFQTILRTEGTSILKSYIYTCSIDGTGIEKIVDFDSEFIDFTNLSYPSLESVN